MAEDRSANGESPAPERDCAAGEDCGASGERSASYRRVEGLHLRQWLLRASAPLAVLATNGAGWVDVPWLPRFDLPMEMWPLPSALPRALHAAGWAGVGIAAGIRVLSKGVLIRKTTLTTGGAYSRVRHPFYAANLLGALSVFALAGPSGALLGLLWLAAAVPVYWLTIRGEESGLSTLYPVRWPAYVSRVPALVPRPWRGRSAPTGAATGENPPPTTTEETSRVTWANLVREREPPRLCRFLAGAAAVTASVSGAGGVKAWTWAAAAVLLFATSHVLPSPPSRRSG